MTFRIVTEPGARVAGLETGEFDAVEDVPQASVERLEQDRTSRSCRTRTSGSTSRCRTSPSRRPTIRRYARRSRPRSTWKRSWRRRPTAPINTNFGFQTQNRAFYTEAGKESYNQKDTEKAKQLLEEAGYEGEKLMLLTNKDYTTMYNAALVMQEQLKAIGMNVRLEVQDWPARSRRSTTSPTAGTSLHRLGHQHLARLPRGAQVPRQAAADLQLRQSQGHRRRVRRGL